MQRRALREVHAPPRPSARSLTYIAASLADVPCRGVIVFHAWHRMCIARSCACPLPCCTTAGALARVGGSDVRLTLWGDGRLDSVTTPAESEPLTYPEGTGVEGEIGQILYLGCATVVGTLSNAHSQFRESPWSMKGRLIYRWFSFVVCAVNRARSYPFVAPMLYSITRPTKAPSNASKPSPIDGSPPVIVSNVHHFPASTIMLVRERVYFATPLSLTWSMPVARPSTVCICSALVTCDKMPADAAIKPR